MVGKLVGKLVVCLENNLDLLTAVHMADLRVAMRAVKLEVCSACW